MNQPLLEEIAILVVEDDPGDYGLLRASLRQAGLLPIGAANTALWAKTLAAGIDQAQHLCPDVTLLDLSLPDSCGLDTVRAMHTAVPHTPIVVLTGNEEHALALAALEAGAQDYLVKGQFDNNVLGRAVRYAMVRHTLEQRLLHHQQHLEEEVLACTVDLSLAKEAAEAANRAKSIFLGTMSHELRTPMNAIIGLVEMALNKASDPDLVAQLSKVDRASEQLLEIINNVLDISKIEAERLTLEHIGFSFTQVLEKLLRVAEHQANNKGLRLLVEVPPEIRQLSLQGDPLRLGQVLRNLVGNAVKFTAAGSVTLRMKVVEEQPKQVLLRFEVQDTGLGMCPEDQKRLFTPFEQVDASTTRKYGGTGLGLAISKRLAQLMGGEIGVFSTAGAGSTFWVTVRLDKVAPAIDGPTAARQPLARYAGTRILLAEDEPISQEILKWPLEKAGLQVDVADDGPSALALARSNAYALILMDIHLPRLNGVQITRAIRANSLNQGTPIIAMTANAFDQDGQACMDAGATDHLCKPINSELLLKTIIRWLGANQPTSSPSCHAAQSKSECQQTGIRDLPMPQRLIPQYAKIRSVPQRGGNDVVVVC